MVRPAEHSKKEKMDLETFRQKREQCRERIFPHKLIRLGELKLVEANCFEIEGQNITLCRGAMQTWTRELGAGERQAVMLVDPAKKEMVDIIVPKKDFMPVDQFFDFSEFFMDVTDTYPEKVETSLAGKMNVVVYLQSNHQQVCSLAPEDDFISNGLFLRWTGDKVSLGNYFTRLICSNGITRQEKRLLNTAYTLSSIDSNRLVQQASSHEMMTHNVNLFKQRAGAAQNTYASLRELCGPWSWMKNYLGMTFEGIAPIVPYEEYEVPEEYYRFFRAQGINTRRMDAQIKTGITIWQLFNNLTQFATHDPTLAPEDVRRYDIRHMAFNLLTAKHDITNYIEYAR